MNKMHLSTDRFIETYKKSGFMRAYTVIVDRETGVNYLYVQSGYGGGLSVMLDEEGKPIVTKL